MDRREHLQRRLACLGDPSRFRILATLQGGRLCVSDVARQVRLSQSCTTRHLQALDAAGIVRPEREGRRVVYVIRRDDPDVAGLVSWLADSSAVPPPSRESAAVRRRPAARARNEVRRVPATSRAADPASSPAQDAAAAALETARPLTGTPPSREVAPDEESAPPRTWTRPPDLDDYLL